MNDTPFPPQRQRRATIKEVAQAAGVSTMTVSRVINQRPDVSPETRQQVLAVIQQLGYQPNSLARSLIQRRSYTLGVVTAGLKYIGPSRTLNGITTQAEELGYNVLLDELPSFNTDPVQPILDTLLARQVDGILWAVPEIGSNRQWIFERLPDLPVPIIFLTTQPQEGLMVVSMDNTLGGYLASRHLVEQGCRAIGHVSGPLDWWEARQRKSGWQQALSEAGLPISETASVEGNWSSASGEKAFRQLVEQYPLMDAVFVANDQMALGALQVAHQAGIRVPQDLAMVGFDNLAEAPYFWPPLSTVQIDQQELGSTAVRALVQMIEASQLQNQPLPSQSILVKPELIVRASSLRTLRAIDNQ